MANICIVGLGTLGTRVAGLWQGSNHVLTLIDRDIVEQENLGIQPIYTAQSIGLPKAYAAATYFGAYGICQEINQTTLHLLGQPDIILDCTDNMATRFLISNFAQQKNIPFVYAAASADQGAVAAFMPGQHSFAKVFAGKSDGLRCEHDNILPQTADAVAQLQHELALQILHQSKNGQQEKYSLDNIYWLDGQTIQSVRMPGGKSIAPILPIRLCGRNMHLMHISPVEAGKLLGDREFLRFEAITLFADGRCLVRASSAETARSIIVKLLKKAI